MVHCGDFFLRIQGVGLPLCSLSNELLGKLYCAFVLPLLDYCDVVWSPSSVQYFKKFERIHSKFCSLTPATQSFLCHTLAERRRFHTAILVYRTLRIHRLSPAYLRETFQYTTTVTSHVGRNSHRLFVPRVRTSYGKNSFYYKGTPQFTLQLLLDNLKTYINLILANFYLHVS